MKRWLCLFVASIAAGLSPTARTAGGPDITDTKMLTQPAVSADHVAFIYAADLWVADLDGRNVRRLTADLGRESNPAFSPDGALLAFNRVSSTLTMYDQGAAEVFVVPVNNGQGGKAIRLVANDPVACTPSPMNASPGVQNTWPKWAPNPAGPTAGTTVPQVINGLTYYWITFSSTRSVTAAGKEQLYVAGITVDANGTLQNYAPIYLWNQSDEVNNLIPAWGAFSIPPGATAPPPPPPPNPPK